MSRFQTGDTLTADALNAMLDGIDAARTFTAAGAGAVVRPEGEKLREWISVLDFGAKGDGTDAGPAFQRAVDSVPLGSYLNISVPPGLWTLATDVVPNGRHPLFIIDGGAFLVGTGAILCPIFYWRDVLGEGRWTPVLRAGGAPSGGGTMTGTWSRSGPIVFLQCDIRLVAAPTGSGAVTVTGSPFVARTPAALSVVSSSGVAGSLRAAIDGDVISLSKAPPGSSAAWLAPADLAYNASFSLSGTFGMPL